MTNAQPKKNWGGIGGFKNKLHSMQSMGKNFQSSMKQSINGFTGTYKDPNVSTSTSRSFRSSTVSTMSSTHDNNTKSSSGARQYQSGRRRSIDRTGAPHYSSSIVNTTSSHGYTKRRKRSLLIGNTTYHDQIQTNSSTNTNTQPSQTNTGGTNLPSNFYPPKDFVNFLYRITEMDGSNRDMSRFGLAILDIDNLRGHIQSPLQKMSPRKLSKNSPVSPSMKTKRKSLINKPLKMPQKKTSSTITEDIIENDANLINSSNGKMNKPSHNKHKSLPSNHQSLNVNADDETRTDSDDDDDDSDDSQSDQSASPLSTGDNYNLSQQHNREDDENELKYIDDEDLTKEHKIPKQMKPDDDDKKDDSNNPDLMDDDSSDDDNELDFQNEAKSLAERTALINHHRRKSSLILKQQTLMLQQYEANKNKKKDDDDDDKKDNDDKKEDIQINERGSLNKNKQKFKPRSIKTSSNSSSTQTSPGHEHRGSNGHINPLSTELREIKKTGNILAVGHSNMDPYLLFWNNSKKGESVVKVVQDILLMSITKDINATHFGFGEFALLANVSDGADGIRRILKKILKQVSSNVATQKLGPVTLSAGLSMYKKGTSISQWVNQCRQSCRLAKTNGRGRISSYLSPESRKKLAVELMLEIKKPQIDFSGSRVLELIRCGADLNFQYKYDTPLMIAIKKKNFRAIRYLIQYDYNPNVQDKKGRTALILAIIYECDDIILDLLVSKRDLNPRVKDYQHNSALSIALKKGYRDIAKTLILIGSEPLLGEKYVLDKWFGASKCGNIKTIETMLHEMNFPVDMIDKYDMTALMHASKTGHFELVKYLLSRGANVNIQGIRGYTALMFAVESGRVQVWNHLIKQQNILIGLNGDDFTTILMCAAKGQMPEVVQFCLSEHNRDDINCDINAKDMDGNTALMYASKNNSVSVATELLRNNSDLDLVNKNEQHSLIFCAMYGAAQIAAMLTTLGSSINHKDKYGKTALMYAAARGQIGIVVNLIKYGADIHEKDSSGLDALDHANKNGKFDVVKMIKNGQLQDVTDVLEQMEILKDKNTALEKAVNSLQSLNSNLTDEINRTEIQKNQIQKKLHDTVYKMKTQFANSARKIGTPTRDHSGSLSDMASPKFPKINLKDKMGDVSNKFGSYFKTHPTTTHSNKTHTGSTPKAPPKDIQL